MQAASLVQPAIKFYAQPAPDRCKNWHCMHADMQHCTCMLLHLLADAKNGSSQQSHQGTVLEMILVLQHAPPGTPPSRPAPPCQGRKAAPPTLASSGSSRTSPCRSAEGCRGGARKRKRWVRRGCSTARLREAEHNTAVSPRARPTTATTARQIPPRHCLQTTTTSPAWSVSQLLLLEASPQPWTLANVHRNSRHPRL